MQLNPIGSNCNEINVEGLTILFSYKTPVAYWESGKGAFKTDKRWSVTTSKHVNNWLRDRGYIPAEVPQVSQEVLDGLIK